MIIGSSSNHEGDSKKKKAIGLLSNTTSLFCAHFFCTFRCRHCRTITWKCLILTFMEDFSCWKTLNILIWPLFHNLYYFIFCKSGAKISVFSKIQLVVYYEYCVLIGWAATRLYVSEKRRLWKPKQWRLNHVLLAQVVLSRYFWPTSWILLKQLFLSPSWRLSQWPMRPIRARGIIVN